MDESRRRPANTASTVSLYACRSELHNAKLLNQDAERGRQEALAARTATTAELTGLLNTHLQLLASIPPHKNLPPGANQVLTLFFEPGSLRLQLPEPSANALVEAAKAAPLVVIRGRTDGSSATPAEIRIASGRAKAAFDFLVAAGVQPDRIRSTYQANGDHAADNSTPEGRSRNRRVEIEIYRTLPTNWTPPNGSSSTPN
ncbi:OmpA family protein [Paucibacter sp. DJ2R-2]|uniref:OmpA family protein n=1 Tax=Paucibacter sp. DJ2R-2 TaxID=2893558 RepID=UPI0021E4D4A7|nr:OmpA family protein [Paucibacter sp. DJ2R-2]MCV2438576.1 OmpA family protein [Paucibacter sp. DJ2R-2]